MATARKKPASKTIPITPDWKDSFKASTFRMNFQLTLSRPMLEFICAVADDVDWDRGSFGGLHSPDNFLATGAALVKRGLVVRKDGSGLDAWRVGEPLPSCYSLTPAGQHVVSLLKCGGLFIHADNSFRKYSKKA